MRKRTWDLAPEELGVRVMETFTRLSERRKVGVANFQSGRTFVAAGLRQASFTVTVEGAFNDVVAAMEDLERPESKLAVGSVALTPRETSESSGRVAATIVLTAFMRAKEST